jgi:murein DD-endopeptidase MepM/ murein hydrolase activator NlpD
MKWFRNPRFANRSKQQWEREETEQPTPDMMQKNRIRIGKMLLLAGLGLSALVLLELRQEVVKAIDLNSNSASEQQAQHTETPAPHSHSIRSQPAVSASAPASSQTVTQPQIAISTDPNPARPQQISQIDPSQIAVNQWSGASFPVENFQTYTSPFGYRRSPTGSYSREFHYGLDLAAPEGSYIRNWWSGTVVEVSDNSNCGTSVVIESGHWLHIYCHMQGHVERDSQGRYLIDRSGGIQIWEGQEVAAGSRIGRVGMTGRTTGPHLHWGLKYDGNWVDPALVLRAMYAEQRAAVRPATSPVQ